MAALHDGEPNLSGHLTANTLHTISGKTTVGADRFGRFSATAGGTAWASLVRVEWNGVDMTLIDAQDDGAGRETRMYGIVNPPASASAIEVEFSAPVAMGYVISSYNGVDPGTPYENTNAASGTGETASVTISSGAGGLVVDVATAAGPTVAEGANQDQEGSDVTDGSNYTMGASREDGAASVEMSWTITSAPWAIIATSLRASGGGGGPTPDAIASSQPRFPRWMARLRG
jgi:hypothetical protein